jgi:Zn-dependent protease
MSWSWRIFRIAGIDVYVHFTFFLLLAWVAYTYQLPGLFFVLALFGIVVLHELGHALAARRYGIGTRDITLLPIGGVARLERMPEVPQHELVVALAGPAVNVALALVFGLLLLLSLGLSAVSNVPALIGNFLFQMVAVNVILVLFNMLPAFPMDGGRVLRALLATRLDYVRATQVAATIGQFMAILFMLAGLFNPAFPMLILIGVFVWLGAAQEARMVQMRSAIEGIPVRRAMITDFRTLDGGDTLARAAEHLLAGCQQDFPVTESDRLVGVLTRSDLAAGLAQGGPSTRVRDVMQREFITTDSRQMLQPAFARLQEGGCHTSPVVEDGRLVGLLTADNVAEVLMIQDAMREAAKRKPGPQRPEPHAEGVLLRGPAPRTN